jgi:hypothetical protein
VVFLEPSLAGDGVVPFADPGDFTDAAAEGAPGAAAVAEGGSALLSRSCTSSASTRAARRSRSRRMSIFSFIAASYLWFISSMIGSYCKKHGVLDCSVLSV